MSIAVFLPSFAFTARSCIFIQGQSGRKFRKNIFGSVWQGSLWGPLSSFCKRSNAAPYKQWLHQICHGFSPCFLYQLQLCFKLMTCFLFLEFQETCLQLQHNPCELDMKLSGKYGGQIKFAGLQFHPLLILFKQEVLWFFSSPLVLFLPSQPSVLFEMILLYFVFQKGICLLALNVYFTVSG